MSCLQVESNIDTPSFDTQVHNTNLTNAPDRTIPHTEIALKWKLFKAHVTIPHTGGPITNYFSVESPITSPCKLPIPIIEI